MSANYPYAVPLPTTLLTLTQFAQILGLDPLHFFGGYSACRPKAAHCHDVWQQHQWQDPGKASRAEMARLIHEAEADIANVVNYWPAPVWVADERYKFQRGGMTPFLTEQRLVARWGEVIEGGATASEAIDASHVTRGDDVDADNDGFAELAQFTITGVPTTWELEEIRACFKEYAALDVENTRPDPASTGYDSNWEIKPLRMRRSGTTVSVYIPVWLLFRPGLQEACNAEALNADDEDSYVDTVRFYRVYTDHSLQSQFLWGTDVCDDVSCAWATQDGCIRVLTPRIGVLVVAPGTYDEDTDCYTASTCYARGTMPDEVRLWYYAGLARPAPWIMDHSMARLVAMLAASRLQYPVCSCSNVNLLVGEWRTNAAVTTKEATYSMTPEMLHNPFGFHLGEIMAWQALSVPGRRIGKAVQT